MTTQAEQEINEATEQVDLEAAASLENESEAGASEPQEETVVSIGEEAPPAEEEARAPEWVRELRRKHRETVKELDSAKKKLEALTAPVVPALGKKPTLEDCDYDADRFESELASWFEQKRKADEEEAKAKQAEEAANAEWNAKLEGYAKAKADLNLKDFDEAEAEAQTVLNVTQRGIIVKASKNPAALIYALGKNTKEGQRLAAIKDPVDFTWEAATLEATQLKVTKKNSPPPPERQVNGSGRISGTVDSSLEKLLDEARKTGNYTKYFDYKQKIAQKG